MTFLLISNGHGEDAIGSALARRLIARGEQVAALPLVGRGRAYRQADVELAGPAIELPSGGYTLDSAPNLVADLRAGLAAVTVGQWRSLRRRANSDTVGVVIGDWYALAMATFFGPDRRFLLQSAMSVRAWPPDAPAWKAPFGPLERSLMRRCEAVFPRDAESAQWLRVNGVDNVSYLGNPMLDAVTGEAALDVPPPYLLLLPGTRGDARNSLPLMLQACERLESRDLAPVVAWGTSETPPAVPGWRFEETGAPEGISYRYRSDRGTVVHVARNSFATILARAKAALSTSGTAAEQCAGRGVPVVGFPTDGPQYTRDFAQAQKRALGRALTLVEAEPAAVARAVVELLASPGAVAAVAEDGRAAMGEPGAAERVVAEIGRRIAAVRGESGRAGFSATPKGERQ